MAGANDFGATEIERGPHHRKWRTASWSTNAAGRAELLTNSYVELATGMHYLTNQTWVRAEEVVEPAPGGAVARRGAHRAFFANNLASPGAIELTLPDGQFLRSTVLGLSYADESGNSVWLARVRDCQGQIQAPNQVLYPSAFDGLEASVRYTYTRNGLEQDVLIPSTTKLPSPAELGLSGIAVRLQVITAFTDPPPAVSGDSGLTTLRGVTMVDDPVVDFGSMKIVRGKAFVFPRSSNGSDLPVAKQWTQLDGINCLIEELPLGTALDALQGRLGRQGASFRPASKGLYAAQKLQLPRLTTSAARADAMRRVDRDLPGKPFLVLDYIVTQNTVSNYTFCADETYYISGQVTLRGTTTIEGGSVLKFTNDYTTGLRLYGPLICKTGPYRMATLTSKDDNTIGATITGSTGQPSLSNATPYIVSAIWTTPNYTNSYQYLRFAFAGYGISFDDLSRNEIWHSQFVRCATAIEWFAGGDCRLYGLHNVLFAKCGAAITDFISGEHLTVDGGGFYPPSLQGVSAGLTNSILACTNVPAASLQNCVVSSSSAGLFESCGAGGYYLPAGGTNRGAGTTSISPGLANDLRGKTTQPPIVLQTNLITADLPLAPQAQRGGSNPDLGYHYDPLDFVLKQIRLRDATLTLAPGTAVATAEAFGVAVLTGGKVVSAGTPTAPIRITRYNLVQEACTSPWTNLGAHVVSDWLGTVTAGEVRFRFAEFSMPAKDGHHFETYTYPVTQVFQDCQLRGGRLEVGVPTLTATNVLFERVDFLLGDDANSLSMSPVLQNCLFSQGNLNLTHWEGGTWRFRDNVFDGVTLAQDGLLDHAYNGYTLGSSRLTPTNASDIVSGVAWQAGPLGTYYQPTNSAFIGKGSLTNASLAGFYHFTTQTNQIKEGTSPLDIGLHYVACGSSGSPVDTDGDGVVDYAEDLDGDGIEDDFTSWRAYDSTNGLSAGNGLQVFTPLN